MKGRAWTEEETLLALWLLPSMRALGRLTDRNFPAIAMKMANLLSVATGGTEGLVNASILDSLVVNRYQNDRDALERRVIELLQGDTQERPELDAVVADSAAELLQRNGVPLHVEIISAMLVARDLSFFRPKAVLAGLLRTHPDVDEVDRHVFRYAGP